MNLTIKKKHLVIAAALLVVVAIGIGIGMFVDWKDNTASEYSAVYLVTGDIYFGRLSWLPVPHLTNVWVIQRGVGAQNQVQFGIVPFKGAAWGPVDRVNLNPREIVFWTRLRKDSQVAQAFQNPSLIQANGTNPNILPQNVTIHPSSSTVSPSTP